MAGTETLVSLWHGLSRQVVLTCRDGLYGRTSPFILCTHFVNKLHLVATCRDGRDGNLYTIWLRCVNILPTMSGRPDMVRQAHTLCGDGRSSIHSLFTYIRDLTGRCSDHAMLQPHHVVSMSYLVRPAGGPRVVVSTAAFHARVRGSVPGLGDLKETKMFLPHPRVKVSIAGRLRDREVACSASDLSCVWRTVSSQLSYHPQEVLLAQFSLYVHKGGLKPDSFYFILPSPAI